MSQLQLRIEVFQASQLTEANRTHQLLHVNHLLNDAYWIMGHPDENGIYAENPFGPRYKCQRIETQNQLVAELGDEGIFAVCTDESISTTSGDDKAVSSSPEDYTPGKYGNIVAVASIKPWAGKKILMYEMIQAQAKLLNGDTSSGNVQVQNLVRQHLADVRQTAHAWEWEVSTCATAAGSQYRGQGLLTKCVDALIEHLRFLQKQMQESGDSRGSLPIHLWVTALVGSPNPAYWLRRGFVNEGPPDIAPKGMWTSLTDFQVQTMKRELS